MNLTDLQVELRAIEERIANLHGEIEKMKPKTDEDKKADFHTITRLAEKYPIRGLMISSAPEVIQKQFIISLAYFLNMEETDIYSRLLYLTRLSHGCNLNLTAEDIYRIGLEYELKDIEILCNDFGDYKYNYVIEALIIANISGEPSNMMISIIADMANILGFDKEQIRVLALISKSILIGNPDILDKMPVPSKNMWSGKVPGYISGEWIKERRIRCISICVEANKESDVLGSLYKSVFPLKDSYLWNLNRRMCGKTYKTTRPCIVLKRPNDGIVVNKGDIILVYEDTLDVSKDRETKGKKEKTVTAPCNGILYFRDKCKVGEVEEVQDKYLEAYVVSYFDDFAQFCE